MERVKVINPCVITYGTTHTAWIPLNINQVWDVHGMPDAESNAYMLRRQGVTIDVPEEDFKRIFTEDEG